MATKFDESKLPAANEVELPASKIPVELNDELRVTASKLTDTPTLVHWTQGLGREKKGIYYAVTFTNKSKSNDPGRLFLSETFLGSFKESAKLADDVYTFTVTDKYLYGQDDKGANRFLVLHDLKNDVFQHRFASNKYIARADQATEMATGAAHRGKEEVKMLKELASRRFGDRLKPFEKVEKADKATKADKV